MPLDMYALRVYLKNKAGEVEIDLTVTLGTSLAMDMVVSGVASRGSRIAANSDSDIKQAGLRV